MIIAELRPYPDQRKSTIPWLPSLPAHWSIRRAKTLFREIDRRTSDGRQPLLSLRMHAGLVDHHASGGKIIPPSALVGYKRVLPGELVMNRMRAAIGLFAGATTEGLVSPDYAVFQVEPTVNLSYAVHLFRTPIMGSVFRMESRGLGTGESGFLRLYTDRFGVLPIPLPPPNEQAAIVRFLDHANRRIDRFIRAKKKLIALLNEQKQAIIHRAVTRGIDPNVPMKDSGVPWLGEIPARWHLLRSRYIYHEVDARSIRGNEIHLSMSQRKGLIRSSELTEKRLISKSYAGGKLCQKNDLVLNRLKAHLGVFALAPEAGVISPDYTIFRPIREIEPRYFESLYRTPACRVVLRQKAKGIVQGFWRLYTDDFYDIRVPVPPLAEQKAIMAALDAELVGIGDALLQGELEISLAREYRTRLIADVVTGQLDVREAVKGLPVEDADGREPVDAGDEIDEAEIDDSDQDEAA